MAEDSTAATSRTCKVRLVRKLGYFVLLVGGGESGNLITQGSILALGPAIYVCRPEPQENG